MSQNKIRTGIIGCGGMSLHHIQTMFQNEKTEIVAICDPSKTAIRKARGIFRSAKQQMPPNQPNLNKFLRDFDLDTVLIATPHAMHHEQTTAALEAGLDVLLEKPMVINTQEGLSLIDTRDRTGKTLVIAFQGSLCPLVRLASDQIKKGKYGNLLSVSATVWQNWGPNTAGTWRQKPALSGGGFIFDTGAHMLNTVADLVNQDFVEVAAWMDKKGRPVEILSVAIAKLKSGAFVTFHGCGEAIPSCSSEIKVFCEEAILTTGVWGGKLQIQKRDEPEPQEIPLPPKSSVWNTFLKVCSKEIDNPSPPEIGLRMIRLYDAICLTAAEGGRIMKIDS